MIIDPSKYAEKGSKIEALISNANRIAEEGVKSGVDQAKVGQFMSGIERSLQAGDIGGLTANYATLDDSIRSAITQNKTASEIDFLSKRFDVLNKEAGSVGISIDPEKIQVVSNLLNAGQVGPATTAMNDIAKPITEALNLKREGAAKLSTEAAKTMRELPLNQKRELNNLVNIKLASGEVTPDALKDPSNSLALATEAKMRDQSKLQAREVFSRLQTVQELLSNAEYMGEFGDAPSTNWIQSLYSSGDQTAMEAKLGKLKGGDLVEGIQILKERTGSAAGLAQSETAALQESINDLKSNLSPKEAEKALRKIFENARFTLNRLGVDPELTSIDGTANVLSNKEQYILEDERAYLKALEKSKVDLPLGATQSQNVDQQKLKQGKLKKEKEEEEARSGTAALEAAYPTAPKPPIR